MTASEYEPIPLAEAITKVITRLTGENPDPGQVARIIETESRAEQPHSAGLTDDERLALDSIRGRLEISDS